MAKELPTVDRSSKNVDSKSGVFLGPMYAEPDQNLGPYPVENGPMPKRVHDPLHLVDVDTAKGKKRPSK
jgi:hypothetical protein